jgi:hypothetical protein
MDECREPLAIEIIPEMPCAFSSYLTKKGRIKDQIRCCNPKNYCQGTTLMQNKPVQQLSEETVEPRLLWPVNPFRRPIDPTEVDVMRAVFKKKGTTV